MRVLYILAARRTQSSKTFPRCILCPVFHVAPLIPSRFSSAWLAVATAGPHARPGDSAGLRRHPGVGCEDPPHVLANVVSVRSSVLATHKAGALLRRVRSAVRKTHREDQIAIAYKCAILFFFLFSFSVVRNVITDTDLGSAPPPAVCVGRK